MPPDEADTPKGTLHTARVVGGRGIKWGFTVKEIYKKPEDESDGYLSVSKVEPTGPSFAAGVLVDDVLLEIDGIPCSSVAEAKVLMPSDECVREHVEVVLTLWRRTSCTTAVSITSSSHAEAENISSDLDNAAATADVHLDMNPDIISPEIPITKPTMDLTPDDLFPRSSSTGHRRSSLYSSQPLPHNEFPCSADFVPSHLRLQQPRGSLDSSYPVCGLPSSTLCRKSVSSKKTTITEPVASSRYNRPLPSIPLHESTTSYMNISRQTMTQLDEPLSSPGSRSSVYSVQSASALGKPRSSGGNAVKNQKMMDLLHSHHVSNSNVFHATPSWSQTEASAMTPVVQVAPELPEKKSAKRRSEQDSYRGEKIGSLPEEVTELSTSMRSVPISTTVSQFSEKFNEPNGDYGSDGCGTGDGLSSGMNSSRSSVSSGPSSLNLNGSAATLTKLTQDRMKARKNLTNASSSSDDLDDSASISHQSSSRVPEGVDRLDDRTMPALRPTTVFGDLSAAKRHNAHLTTQKEVRTYQINRPHLQNPKETGHIASSASVRSSPISAPEEYRHARDASLDSSVSWQSNSTQSSGYSSVALSSSTPTLEERNSSDGAPPGLEFRERSNTGFGVGTSASRQANKPSVSGNDIPSDKPTRSMSVSELVNSFSGSDKPLVPQKLSYTHLSARPDGRIQPPAVPAKPKSALQQGPRSQFAKSQVTFASMEDVRETNDNRSYTRRASTAETPSFPKAFPGENSGSYNVNALKTRIVDGEPISPSKKPALAVKPSPIFRTAVYGVNLKANRLDVRKESISESEEPGRNQETGEERERYVPKYRKSLDKVEAGPKSNLVNRQAEADHLEVSVQDGISFVGSNQSSPTNELELNHAKEQLKDTIQSRVALLREDQDSVREEIDANEGHGEEIFRILSHKAPKTDVEKYMQHLREMEEITSLTMSLVSRIDRLDRMLAQLRSPGDDLEASTVATKRKKLVGQHEEALHLEKGILRRREQVQAMLATKYFSPDENELYVQFFTTRIRLFRDRRSLEDKIKLGEEQLVNLQNFSISYSS